VLHLHEFALNWSHGLGDFKNTLLFSISVLQSPDYYYSVLDSHLGFKDVLDTLEFTYAMDRLLGSERLI